MCSVTCGPAASTLVEMFGMAQVILEENGYTLTLGERSDLLIHLVSLIRSLSPWHPITRACVYKETQ